LKNKESIPKNMARIVITCPFCGKRLEYEATGKIKDINEALEKAFLKLRMTMGLREHLAYCAPSKTFTEEEIEDIIRRNGHIEP